MLAQFRWCISVALCLDAQLIVSKPDTTLPSLAGGVALAGSEPKWRLLEIRCLLCSRVVDLQNDLFANENGMTVHEDCYVRHITGMGASDSRETPSIWFFANCRTSTPFFWSSTHASSSFRTPLFDPFRRALSSLPISSWMISISRGYALAGLARG